MTVMETNYRRAGGKGEAGGGSGGGVGQMVNYLDKDHATMYDGMGRELDEQDLNEFARESKQNRFQRMVTFSPPENHDLTDSQMSLHARETLDEYLQERPEASYVYTIHHDKDVPHVQAAMTGSKDDLAMYDEQIEELQNITVEKFTQSLSEAKKQEAYEMVHDDESMDQAEAESASMSRSIGGRA